MSTTLENFLSSQREKGYRLQMDFCKERRISGATVCYKSRLEFKGYAQREGINYNEIFLFVVKHSSIRILLMLAAQYEYDLDQLDVKTTFLHDDLNEEIYMTQPLGFRAAGKEKLVFKLQKSLYGLKQSPTQWYKRFDKFMIDHGYTRIY